MIREIVKPSSNSYVINIPEEYINKKIEILVLPFSYNEKVNDNDVIFDPKEYYNASKSSKQEIDTYLNNIRDEWDNSL